MDVGVGVKDLSLRLRLIHSAQDFLASHSAIVLELKQALAFALLILISSLKVSRPSKPKRRPVNDPASAECPSRQTYTPLVSRPDPKPSVVWVPGILAHLGHRSAGC